MDRPITQIPPLGTIPQPTTAFGSLRLLTGMSLDTFAGSSPKQPTTKLLYLSHHVSVGFGASLLHLDRRCAIHRIVGLQGFEPWPTEPKSVVLPLHHSPLLWCAMCYVLCISGDTRIRTLTNRTKICCATVTPYPYQKKGNKIHCQSNFSVWVLYGLP